MATAPLRVLAIDHEGGHGGSSRSLFLLLSFMDRTSVDIEVWTRRSSWMVAEYSAMGIACRVIPELPLFRAQRSAIYTARQLLEATVGFRRHRALLAGLAREIDRRFDVVHFNFESLYPFAWWLRKQVRASYVMHMRNRPYPSWWARLQSRFLATLFERFVFITENERERFAELGGDASRGEVVFNPVPVSMQAVRHASIPDDGRLNVTTLGNVAYERGVYRTIEIAEVLAGRGARDRIRFVVAGDNKLSPQEPGELGRIGTVGGTLRDFAAAHGVADMFLFLGHVPEPESVLAASDIVMKLARRNEPWGRDVIEALAFGRPVMATGTWSGFVRDGHSGWLVGDFNAHRCADILLAAEADRDGVAQLGAAGRAHIEDVCNGPARARDLGRIWRESVQERGRKHGTH